jgi:hypothetical protein
MQRVRSGEPPLKKTTAPEHECPFCRCGCGEHVTKPLNQYVQGHARRHRHANAVWFGKRLDEKLQEEMRAVCAVPDCPWSMRGTARDCIDAAREHRQQEHGAE